jgi:surfactin synthase thioesterase subunit
VSRYQRLAGGRLGLLHFDTVGPVTRRLLCFPHGGGGPHSFAALSAALPAGFAVTAVEPPGRPRTGNSPPNRITALLDVYLEHLPADLLADCVLLGHSVGGYVATALAARLENLGRSVRAVVVSAAVPPRFLDPGMPLSAMTDEQRFDWCRGLGTFPVAMPEARALFDLFADSIRADCEAFETAGEAPMAHRAPMLVLGGDADPMCPGEQLRSWTDTHPQAVVRQLPGGHMLPQEAAGPVADQIAAFVRRTPAGPRADVPWRREDLRLRGPNGVRCPCSCPPARSHRTGTPGH